MWPVRAEPSVLRVRAPYAVARALAATVVVVIGAAAAHTWAGGTVPTAPGLLLVSAVVLGGGLMLFTREVPLRAVLPAVAAAQLGLHESFGLVADHSAHAHHAAAAAPEPGWTWQMVLAHAGVTVLTAVLWWAGRRLASLVVTFGAGTAAAVLPRLRAPRARVRAHARSACLASPRRGPPPAVTCA
jgi:hypothetical protein